TASGRTGDDDHPVGRVQHPVINLIGAVREAKLRQRDQGAAAIEQPQYDLLAPDRLERCDPDVELATVHRHADLTVLRPTALDDVHVRKHLDARGKRRSSGGGQVRDVAQHTVDRESDAEALLVRFHVARGREGPEYAYHREFHGL